MSIKSKKSIEKSQFYWDNKNNGIKEKIIVDMHMHTIYSDGDKTVEEVLKMCEENKLEYISITDHNTTKQYGNEWSNKFFSYEILKEKFENAKNKIIDICNKNNLTYDLNAIRKDIPITDFFVVYMYYELIKHEENL